MEPFIVTKITFPFTNLVDQNEKFHASIAVKDCLAMARQTNFDLVCFGKPEDGKPGLCKIIDYGKWKYQREKALKKEKSNKKTVKELRFSYVIGDHDIEHKVKQAIEFLKDGDDVVLTMKLMGREMRFIKEAKEKMSKIASMCSGGKIISEKEMYGQIIIKMSS